MADIVSTPRDLGALIRDARRSQRIRQEDLAAAVGSSHRFLRDLERGDASQVRRLFDVLAELGLTVSLDAPPAMPHGSAMRRRAR